MSDYLNFMSENQAFQNIMQYGQQKQEAYKQEQQQGIFDIVESFPLISDTTEKVKDIYARGQKLYKTGQEALSKLSENVQKGQEALSEGIGKIKGSVSKFQDLAQDTKKAVLDKAQELKSMTSDELNGLKSRYGDRFNSELSKLQQAKNDMATNMYDKFLEKRSQLADKYNSLQDKLGRDLTAEEKQPFSDSLKQLRTEFNSKFNEASSNLENTLKSNLSEGSKLSQGIGERLSRKLNIQDFEMDPEGYSPSKLSSSLGEKVVSVFRGGSSPKIPSMEVPKLGVDIPKVSDVIKAEDIKGLVPKINPLETGSKIISDVKGDVGRIAEGVVSKGSEALAQGGEIAQKAVNIGGEVAGAVADTAETVGGLVAESIPVVGEVFGAGLALYEGLKGLFEPKPHIFSVARPSYVAGI